MSNSEATIPVDGIVFTVMCLIIRTLSRPVRHGAHSGSPAQNRRRGLSDQTAIGSQPGIFDALYAIWN